MATGYHGWFAVAAGGRQTLVDRPSFKQKGRAQPVISASCPSAEQIMS
jgi:hypothetical protein